MAWYYNQVVSSAPHGFYPSGVFEAHGAAATQLDRLILEEGKQGPLYGPFPTRDAAESFARTTGHTPSTGQQWMDAQKPNLPGLGIVGDIENWFVRAGEMALGLVLLALAINLALAGSIRRGVVKAAGLVR